MWIIIKTQQFVQIQNKFFNKKKKKATANEATVKIYEDANQENLDKDLLMYLAELEKENSKFVDL